MKNVIEKIGRNMSNRFSVLTLTLNLDYNSDHLKNKKKNEEMEIKMLMDRKKGRPSDQGKNLVKKENDEKKNLPSKPKRF